MARTYHAACQGNQYMFIYGGECLDDLDSFYALNLVTLKWQELPKGAQSRRFASLNFLTLSDQDYVVLLGGCLPSYLPTS